MMYKIQALVFDFDGLILDTEGPIYKSWHELYQKYDCQLSLEKWATIIGAAEEEVGFDPLEELEVQLGYTLENRQKVVQGRRDFELALILEQEILPGVYEYLYNAKQMGLKIGLASSSPRKWVHGHLTRLELIDFFECIRTADDVSRAKPDPALYQQAITCLGVTPKHAIALEDSANGAIAAKRAGLYTVVVPNSLTRKLPSAHADLRLDSLLDLPLDQLLAKAEREVSVE